MFPPPLTKHIFLQRGCDCVPSVTNYHSGGPPTPGIVTVFKYFLCDVKIFLSNCSNYFHRGRGWRQGAIYHARWESCPDKKLVDAWKIDWKCPNLVIGGGWLLAGTRGGHLGLGKYSGHQLMMWRGPGLGTRNPVSRLHFRIFFKNCLKSINNLWPNNQIFVMIM